MSTKEVKVPEVQKVLVAVKFTYGVNEDGGELINAEMDVEYMPKIPMLDRHKKDYGVDKLQAACAKLPQAVERELEVKGYNVIHPGKDNPKL